MMCFLSWPTPGLWRGVTVHCICLCWQVL